MPRINKQSTPAPWHEERKAHGRRKYHDPRYNSSRWRKARSIYLKHHPRCKECNRLAGVVDHIKPVRLGGEFYDPDNWQALCTVCHNRKSGKEAHEQ